MVNGLLGHWLLWCWYAHNLLCEDRRCPGGQVSPQPERKTFTAFCGPLLGSGMLHFEGRFPPVASHGFKNKKKHTTTFKAQIMVLAYSTVNSHFRSGFKKRVCAIVNCDVLNRCPFLFTRYWEEIVWVSFCALKQTELKLYVSFLTCDRQQWGLPC